MRFRPGVTVNLAVGSEEEFRIEQVPADTFQISYQLCSHISASITDSDNTSPER